MVWQTPYARLSFPSLFQPRINKLDMSGDPKGKYEAVLIFPANATAAAVHPKLKPFWNSPEHMEAVQLLQAKAQEVFGSAPEGLKAEIRKQYTELGVEKNLIRVFLKGETQISGKTGAVLPGFENGIVLRVKTGFPPQVLGPNKEEIMDPNEIYAGCYVRAQVSVYAFNPKQAGYKKGIKFQLEAIQKCFDGEHLGGGRPDWSEGFGVETEEARAINLDNIGGF